MITEEQKISIFNRVEALYETCGNVSPIIYFIEALSIQSKLVRKSDHSAFEEKLTGIEDNLNIFYNKDGVSKLIAESEDSKNQLLYLVRSEKESEGRYFYHIELANLFIRELAKKSAANIRLHLSKTFNGFSVSVTSPLFFC